ncbi:MAG: hypothetical protein ACYSWU_14600 [Planctomycetota bacterium]|jgi:hypothetical protein
MFRTVFVLAWVFFLVEAAPSYAELLSHERFDYLPVGSDLLGKSGGSGFGSAPWFATGFNATIHTNYDIAEGSLEFPKFRAEGNRIRSGSVSQIAGIGRGLADPIAAGETTTRYISFLLRPEGTLGRGAWNGFFGLYLDGSSNGDLFVGKPGAGAMSRYVLEDRGGARQFASDANVVVDETSLLVLKAEFTPGLDRFTLYVNPDPIDVEPASGTVKNDMNIFSVNSVVVYSTGAFSMDEVCVGETYSDVIPIPEPCTLMLLSAGVLCALARTRRRNRRR